MSPRASSIASKLSALALAALAAVALAACRRAPPHPANLLGMRSADQHALDACRKPVQAKACGGRTDADACWQEVGAAYEALPDAVARKRFLLDAGCPSPTVDAWLPDPR